MLYANILTKQETWSKMDGNSQSKIIYTVVVLLSVLRQNK